MCASLGEPPVGGFRMVAGLCLFVDERGNGSSRVVFLPGAGSMGLDLLPLHERASRTWTSLVYDRAGTGWSQRVPLPRSAHAVTEELRTLLATTGDGPVTLVGHSLGGLYARHFANRFPHDVAGLVLLDPAHEDYDASMPTELTQMRSQNRMLATLARVLDLATRTRPSRALLGLLPAVRHYQRLYRSLFEQEMADWQPDIREALVTAHTSLDGLAVGLRESRNVDDLYDEVRQEGGMPDVPTVILSSTGTDAFRDAVSSGESPDLIEAESAAKLGLYQRLATTVSRGEVRPVEGGHVTLPYRHGGQVIQAVTDVTSGAHPTA